MENVSKYCICIQHLRQKYQRERKLLHAYWCNNTWRCHGFPLLLFSLALLYLKCGTFLHHFCLCKSEATGLFVECSIPTLYFNGSGLSWNCAFLVVLGKKFQHLQIYLTCKNKKRLITAVSKDVFKYRKLEKESVRNNMFSLLKGF